MLKILQARLQQYVNHELPDGQAGFRKGRGTRDQIANISWCQGPSLVDPGNSKWRQSRHLGKDCLIRNIKRDKERIV